MQKPQIIRTFIDKAAIFEAIDDRELGFRGVASGPLVRSSYWADKQISRDAGLKDSNS
jgi:lipoate synthase